MIDLSARRARFRSGIVAEAEALANAKLGSIQAVARVVNIPIVLGAKGAALTAGTNVDFRLGLNGQANVLTWSLSAKVAGAPSARTAQLDVQVGATLATVGSICGLAANRPQLAAQIERNDQLPTGWTTVTIADPSTILVTVISADGTVEVVSLTLRVAVSPR